MSDKCGKWRRESGACSINLVGWKWIFNFILLQCCAISIHDRAKPPVLWGFHTSMQLWAKSSMKSPHTKCNSEVPKKDLLIININTQTYKIHRNTNTFTKLVISALFPLKQTWWRVCVHADNDTRVKTDALTNIPKNTFVYLCLLRTSS